MKRWNKKAVELLRQQSEQSRKGEPVTPGNNLDLNRATTDEFTLQFRPLGSRQGKSMAVVQLSDGQGRAIELHIRRRPKGRANR